MKYALIRARFLPVLFGLSVAIAVVVQAHASETDRVLSRIQASGYPMPASTIADLPAIERELTPVPLSETWEILPAVSRSGRCQLQTVRIFYKVEATSALERFEATFAVPVRRPRRPVTRVPAIVIQPTLAGPSALEQNIARDLCRIGFASIVPNETILDLPDSLPDFGAYDRNLRAEMIRARRMVDFLVANERVERTRLGVIGFSRGAIAGALLMGIEPRVGFGYLGAGGVGVGRIIARSRTEKGKTDNARQMQASGLNQEQFETALIETIRYDGLLFAHRVRPENLKLMIVPHDELVSTESQELLRKSFGEPETLYRDHGHVGSIVGQVFLEDHVYLDFFKSKAGI